jgi:type III pantothenate kinase
MILVIDIGNTSTKIAVFRQDELVHVEQHQNIDALIINKLFNDYLVNRAIISSVKKENAEWENLVAEKIPLIYFNGKMAKGIINHYQTPETLGPDRLAAVIGAKHLYPAKSNLIIGGGTAITYDWVDAGGNYFGGSISPGLNMRYKALNNYTAGLPLVTADENFAGNYGNNTTAAIRSGVQNGIKFELNGFIESYRKNEQEFNVVLCGGDGIFFDTLLKNSIFAPCIKIEPHLVLKGLNAAIHNNND